MGNVRLLDKKMTAESLSGICNEHLMTELAAINKSHLKLPCK